MTTKSLFVAAALGCTLVSTSQLSAQTSTTGRAPAGFFAGLTAHGSLIDVDDVAFGARDRENGRGMYATVGYGFTPNIGLLVHVGGGEIGKRDAADRTIGDIDLALRYTFARPAQSVLPYLEVGVGAFRLEDETQSETVKLDGTSLSAAAGINYFVLRSLAINADIRYTRGVGNTMKVGDVTVSEDAGIAIDTSRLSLGVNWYPFAR